ncbi:MAG: hypothetical protein HYT12_00295 [Candidatus Liptonbacteria bacterium]|nr:hypothetical protein [Candidatus Liptonbacteria bacterium]
MRGRIANQLHQLFTVNINKFSNLLILSFKDKITLEVDILGMPKLSIRANAGLVFFALLMIFITPPATQAATLSINPTIGTFSLGSTFSASIYIDTEGESINLFDIYLKFPADKLQIISPAVGKSIAAIWTTIPTVDNENGVAHLQGGIPKGINTTDGLITSINFRVRRVGEAVIKFQDNSKVLLNDGKGTDILRDVINAIYYFTLPPPAGPHVVSATHPDQGKWYQSGNLVLAWPSDPKISSYSYVLSDNPVETPDDISEGLKTSIGYNDLKSGIHYFHIKGKGGDAWGGTTHFAVNIDRDPPAEFSIEVLPGIKTVGRNLVVSFFSSDRDSGIDHYEYKLVPLNNPKGTALVRGATESFFIETTSPIALTALDIGSYDFIVRAYDKAGNWSDERTRIEIRRTIFRLVTGEGLRIWGIYTVPWVMIWIIASIIIALLLYSGIRFRKWHHGIISKKSLGAIPVEVQPLVDELKRYRNKYGKILILILSLWSLLGLLPNTTLAETAALPAPYVTLAPSNITNNEVLYIGGKTTNTNEAVIVYIQSEQTGETFIERVMSDGKGDWFYSRAGFLPAGRYTLWVQAELNDVKSPPSPRFDVFVSLSALQFGASRLSREALYLIIITLFLILAFVLIAYSAFHFIQGRKKHKLFLDHVKQVESGIMRGFAVLKRDIEAELVALRKNRVNGEFSSEEKQKESELLRDFEWVEKYVGKEIWEMKIGEHDLS